MPVIENFASFIAGGGLVCPPDKKKIEYSVSDEPGLFVECRSSATSVPTWYLRLKNGKKSNCYKRVGTHLSLPQAKKLSAQFRAEHLLARNVEAAPKADPKEMTLDTFMRDHYLPHAFLHKRSAKKDEQLYRIHIGPRFKDTLLSQITRRDVQVFHNGLLTKGQSPASADHSIKLLRAACNWAVRAEYLETNKLTGIQLFLVANEIENYLDDAQMQRLLEVLRTDKNRPACLILMMLISTGARLNEVQTAMWKNLSIGGRSLKIDATRSKSTRSRSIPLNDSAMWVLEQLDSKGKSEYLFPSPVFAKQGKDLPYTNITKARVRIFKLAGVSIRAHDLRHGFASMLVSAGRSLYEVQQILGHSDPKVTMRYAHLSSKTLQAAASAASVIVPKQQIRPSTDAANMGSVEMPVAEPQAA